MNQPSILRPVLTLLLLLLLALAAHPQIESSFERFWQSELARPVEGLLQKSRKTPDAEKIQAICQGLHRDAAHPENFAPEVRQTLRDLPKKFALLVDNLVWEQVRFISDQPGKNAGDQGLGDGGESTAQLAQA